MVVVALAALCSTTWATAARAEEPPGWARRDWLELALSASSFLPSCESCGGGASLGGSLLVRWQHLAVGVTAFRWTYGLRYGDTTYPFFDWTIAPEVRGHLFGEGRLDVYASVAVALDNAHQVTKPDLGPLLGRPRDYAVGGSWYLLEHLRLGPRLAYRRVVNEAQCCVDGAYAEERSVNVSSGWLLGFEVTGSFLK